MHSLQVGLCSSVGVAGSIYVDCEGVPGVPESVATTQFTTTCNPILDPTQSEAVASPFWTSGYLLKRSNPRVEDFIWSD